MNTTSCELIYLTKTRFSFYLFVALLQQNRTQRKGTVLTSVGGGPPSSWIRPSTIAARVYYIPEGFFAVDTLVV